MKLTPQLLKSAGFVLEPVANHWSHQDFTGLFNAATLKTLRALFREVAQTSRRGGRVVMAEEIKKLV